MAGKYFACKVFSRAPKKRKVFVEQKRIIASVNLACITLYLLGLFMMFQNAKSLKNDRAMILEQKAFSGFCYKKRIVLLFLKSKYVVQL